ncbi:23S rRNA (uracil(747)-C(5))-methyltransferase RlmC [Pasteurella multocida]|uniref:23S rRNA (uracil(747)-C(5))-methyltransferase RlmC n=1 Tax=Pasteurella multocida TaxID=747 RepID=UPI00202018EC|nr:23S rRNA (uracil(747)-C(5))-methyltransferase RlmC [Pasteurella multocida]MCL7825877.1 23S rRNA (uracil(747)-C(5))-methyltransferase RlmC [Pasteurella multocida]MDY0577299.1 23S rRNA (uracil(747)-C(5))-methyltransferase RlmC [Pasteurella multocida]MEB3496669.1 23S rRNA (uracil(747)-C(5))-methyltransferase RlmC [Pasteurella multocida]MEB3500150.1 23S rRNA (uracil(747)-C(5))-methyltransferase RlmC [Pasteurella multocida]URH77211.1 23S rRNA (uracil(747)-C(5))-methyltransferase RlmC [Pasteurell
MSSPSTSFALPCQHYQRGDCRSCQWLATPYSTQLAKKQQHLQQQLQKLDCTQIQWQAPYTSILQGFRNKAKMAVSGMVERPILSHPQSEADLTDCPLYPAHFTNIFTILRDFIARAGLVPYNIQKQKGELKYILLTESQLDGGLMLRFVLRSEKKLPLVQRELPGLLAKLPQLKVVSLNIQPQHAAILEGEKEIFLTEQHTLEECFNQIPLFIRPQGFFQTNPQVAQGLYGTAQHWVQELPVHRLWDLFCGVGGFGLHCAQALQAQYPDRIIQLTGIEISASAIEAATLSAQKLGLKQVKFQSLDAKHFALAQSPAAQDDTPELVIVNPPRRGIGIELAQFLNQLAPHFILYSSCNAETMGKDVLHLSDYQLKKVQLFDMFPHTSHYEVLCLLERK